MDPRFVTAIRKVDPDVTCDELADIVWLATHLRGGRATTDRDSSPNLPGPGEPPDRNQHPPGTENVDLSPESRTGRAGRLPSGEYTASLRLPPHRLTGEAPGVSTRSPAVPAIPSELEILRALVPLRRRVPSTSQTEPDEVATASWIAETGLWFPKMVPVHERWLDVALVIDDSASMTLWQRTALELRSLLERTGAFRDVRVWHMDGDLRHGTPVSISSAAPDLRGRRAPAELIDPVGRRLIVIASDCVGRAWGHESTGRALTTWASAGPTVVIQMLPQRLWAGCAPELHPVRLRGIQPGLANSRLMVEGRDGHVDLRPYGLPIPVLELESRWLRPWASLISGAAGSWVNGTVMLTGFFGVPAGTDPPPTPMAPDEHLSYFRAQSSPTAYRLAVVLAAGAPLTLPVMRLVQAAMLPSSKPSHLAEVFLSGILRRSAEENIPEQSPDEVEYEFLPGIRDELLDELPRHEALQVLATVSNFVSQRFGSPLDFRALLTAARPPDSATLSPAFAEVAVKVLSALGGRYAEAAERLTRLAAEVEGVRYNDQSMGDQLGDDVTSASPAPAFTEPGREKEVLPKIMRGVPSRNPRFTGRGDLISRVHNMLITSTERAALLPHTLHGLGGVGKTQLAIEYVYRFAQEYDLIAWLPAEDPTQVRASLVELGSAMGLPEELNMTRAVEAVLDALRTGDTYRRWLLVFDNADQPKDLQPYLPKPNGHVLLTSRNADWSEFARTFEIDVFTRPESIALLRQRAPEITDEDADRLADRLGDLPLALDQAGAWHAATGMPVSEYLRLFEDEFERLTAHPTLDYPTSVGATYALTLNRLRQQSPGAAQLLDVCAFFGADPISVGLLWDGRQADLPEPLADTLRDEIQLRRALREIGRYALARVDPVEDQITVHRLVQVVLRSRLDDEEREQTKLSAQRILAAANPGNPDARKNWERHSALWPHIVPAELLEATDDRARRVVLDQIRYRWIRGDYESSHTLGRTTVVTWRARWGDDDTLTLIACRHLALTLRILGQYEEASTLAEQTLSKFRDAFGDNHEHTLVTVDAVSWGRRISGKYKEAKELDEDNLVTMRHDLGDDHPLTLRTANNYAIDLRWLGDFARARELDEESVRLRRLTYGDEDRNTQLAVASLARDHYNLGNYTTGLALQEAALPVQRRLLGPDHAEVLSETRNLVVLLRKVGQHARARDEAEKLVQTYEQRFGQDDEPTLAANMSYVNALRTTGQLEDALRLGRECLERYRRAYGPEHPATLVCATNVAIVLRHRGFLEEALSLNETTLAAFRTVLGDNHPFTLCCATNNANDLAGLHHHARARELSEDTLRRSREVRGDEHPDTLACALNAALDRRAAGDETGVEPLLANTISGFQRRLGKNHPETLGAMAGQRADCDIEPPET
jgi:tetratricopeptide (TPR) repeat protein